MDSGQIFEFRECQLFSETQCTIVKIFSVVFDERARKEFLTGFRKRKDERRKKAQEEIEKKLKDEIKKIKADTREKVILLFFY